MATKKEFLDQVKKIPASPGIYLMKNAQADILYIGKAKSLKNRLFSYFQPSSHPIVRIKQMLEQVNEFEVILTHTEVEAFILENTLIKKYQPKFNIRLRDDKTYPYLKIDQNQDFPRIQWTRRILRDQADYFGPFPSSWAAKQVMDLLNQTFQLRTCSDNTFRDRARPCILYEMGHCSAPCVNLIQKQAYQACVQKVVQILRGKTDDFIGELEKKMQALAQQENFEKAAWYRDQIQNLKIVTQTQGIVEAGSIRNRDVIGLARSAVRVQGVILHIEEGQFMAVRHYELCNVHESISQSELLFDFLTQAYLSQKKKEQLVREILVPIFPEEKEFLEQGLHIPLMMPQSELDTQLLNVAHLNAKYALNQKQFSQKDHEFSVLKELQNQLHLSQLPERIECYDVSNIQGENAVASRVVFIHGNPDKTLYRRYKIQYVQGANDFAMMQEVLYRRFLNHQETVPNLVIVDGGKGQLAQVLSVFKALKLQGIDAIALAKARVESDFSKQEISSSLERVFIPQKKDPILVPSFSHLFRILTHIRNEAHRFAIQYYRKLHTKRTFS